MIPANRFDPAFAKILQLFPGSQPDDHHRQPSRPATISTTHPAARKRIRATPASTTGSATKTTCSVRSAGAIRARRSVAPFPGALDNSGFNGTGELDLNRNGQVSYTRVWKPTVVTETRASFTRLVTSRVGANPDADLFKQFGIGGYNPTTAYTANGGLPNFTAGGYTGLRRRTVGSHARIQQRLGLCPERRDQQGVARDQDRRGIPAGEVPVLPGSRSSRNRQLQRATRRRSRRRRHPLSDRRSGPARATRSLRRCSARWITRQISTTNFISSQKVAWAGYVQDDWKVSRES